MITDQPFVVEITGVMGAGFPPGLLSRVAKRLQTTFVALTDHRPRRLHTRHYVDNTLLQRTRPESWATANAIINRGDRCLADHEVEQLGAVSLEADDLINSDIDLYPAPVDVVLRRGGVLQSYIHIQDARFQLLRMHRRLEPKLLFFLTADASVVDESYQRDDEFRRLRTERPEDYCLTADRALYQQSEWLAAIHTLPGVTLHARTTYDVDQLSAELSDRIASIGHQLVSLETLRQASCFLSYSHHDTTFADRLFSELKRCNVQCSYFPEEPYPAGEVLWAEIQRSLAGNASIVLVASKDSLTRSEGVMRELDLAMDVESQRGTRALKVVALDSWLFDGWQHGLADTLRDRVVADFRGWETSDEIIARGLSKLLAGLRLPLYAPRTDA